MGITHLWDTNVVIYYLQQQFPTSGEKFIDDLFTKSVPAMSAITEIELLCWRTATETDVIVVKDFIRDTFIIELEPPIKLKAVEIRKMTRLKLPDAIIATTAIVSDLTFLTRNTQNFNSVSDLQTVNLWNL